MITRIPLPEQRNEWKNLCEREREEACAHTRRNRMLLKKVADGCCYGWPTSNSISVIGGGLVETVGVVEQSVEESVSALCTIKALCVF